MINQQAYKESWAIFADSPAGYRLVAQDSGEVILKHLDNGLARHIMALHNEWLSSDTFPVSDVEHDTNGIKQTVKVTLANGFELSIGW